VRHYPDIESQYVIWTIEGVPTMRKRIVASRVVLAMLVISPLARPQTAPPNSGAANYQKAAPDAPVDVDDWGHPVTPPSTGQKAAPAPRHDISGIWDPGIDPIKVLGVLGASAMPEDGKPEHQLPYTPLGRETLNLTKPTSGGRSVLPAETNDPVVYCDPQGMPREDLYELRTTQILQTPKSLYFLYQFGKIWRVVWTDGRDLPKDPEPRWFGYSVGIWIDDYTFVVQTSGIDERTWIDRAGRPHSGDLRVEERFHRVDHDHLELTVTIDDPKMYTKPWVARDRLSFQLQKSDFDVREMLCSPKDLADYNKLIGDPVSSK
jgi:hypothetical protein